MNELDLQAIDAAYEADVGQGAFVAPSAPPPAQGAASWRQVPDGSLIRGDCVLTWDPQGVQGHPSTRVRIRDGGGSMLYDGYFGELQQVVVPGVWVPIAARQAQAQQQQQQPQQAAPQPFVQQVDGLGAGAPAPDDEEGGALKAFGVCLSAVAAGVGSFFVARHFMKKREEAAWAS